MITRALVVCFLAVMLSQPAAAGKSPFDVTQITNRPHLLEAIVWGVYGEAMVPWLRTHTLFSNSAVRPSRNALISFNSATSILSQCNQKLASAPDARCVRACDGAKEACDRQCSVALTTCLDQCLGVGFACDYYCRVTYLRCKSNCGRDHDACLFNCPTRGGGKES